MKKVTTLVLTAITLIACSKTPANVFDPNSVEIPDRYGVKVSIVSMIDGTTCYVAHRQGTLSISCLRK